MTSNVAPLKIKQHYAHGVVFFVFSLHLLFLFADPAVNFDFSRGPFTDEGFYLAQLRNFLNGHGWGVEKADALLKSPLFALLFYLPLKIFGVHLCVARLFLLLYSLVIWITIIRQRELRLWGCLFLLFGATEQFLFEYSHYIMPEILCCHLIVFGLFSIYKYLQTNRLMLLLLSAVIFSAVWFIKVQFIYILPLPLGLFVLFRLGQLHNSTKEFFLHFFALCLTLLLFVSLYYFFWYKPHEGFYNYLFITENKSRIQQPGHLWETIRFYYKHVLLIPDMWLSTQLFWVALLSGVLLPFFARLSFDAKFFLLASLFWFALELHKLILLYIPLRYIIPLIYASYFFGAVALSLWLKLLYQYAKSTRFMLVIGLIFLVAICPLAAHRVSKLHKLTANTTYNIKSANEYLRQNIKTSKMVVGNWSATLGWEIKNETMPITHMVINDEKIGTTIFPEVIIAEGDEMDSDGAYYKRGIDLTLLSDSSKQFSIGKWSVNIWWMKPEAAFKSQQKKQ